MKTMMKSLTVLGLTLAVGCTSPPEAKPTTPAPIPEAVVEAPTPTSTPAPAPDPIKIAAPVEMNLSKTGVTGTVRVTLKFTVTADVPTVVARFVVPEGVTVRDGTAERTFGAMAAGAAGEHTVTLVVPADGLYQLGAGVDCVIHAGMTLNASRVLSLGAGKPPEDQSRVVRPANSATGLRLSPAK